ncbi:FAD-dependent oxidoreductase, partial [candidate division TA06 bacterium]|nr:FAD-dependent oxidoreductase [candidate division TA06 bacterium]
MEKFDLVILGGGAAAFAAATKANDLKAKTAIVNSGLPIGGTCVNVGCVPSKTLIRAAEALHRSSHHNFLGIDTSGTLTDFRSVIDQKRFVVAEMLESKYKNVIFNKQGVTVIEGHAKLISPTKVEVNDERLSADCILIATGAAPFVPDIPGLHENGYLTNETAFELEELPDSLIVLGGRYISLECAQMFSRFGSKVTILQRSERILPSETADITDALTEYLTQEGIDIVTGVHLERVQKENGGYTVYSTVNGNQTS